MNRGRMKGMTLLEVVVVIALMSMLIGVVWIYVTPMMHETSATTAQKRYDDIGANVLQQLETQIRYTPGAIITADTQDTAVYRSLTTVTADGASRIVMATAAGEVTLFGPDFFGSLVPTVTYTLNGGYGLTIRIVMTKDGTAVYDQSDYVELVNMKLAGTTAAAASGATIWYKPSES